MTTLIEEALPAGSGELDEDLFPMRQRVRLRDNFGLALREFRQTPPFASIDRGPWAVFIAIASAWQSHSEAWPTQEKIAAFCGYTVRAVHDHIYGLEALGFIRLRRQRSRDGGERLYYAPGRTTLAALIAFIERYPHDWTRSRAIDESADVDSPSSPDAAMEVSTPLEAAEAPLPEPVSERLPEAISAPLPEAIAGRLPEAISDKPREKLKEPSSCRAGDLDHASPEQEKPDVTREDRDLARAALAERMKRKHPKRTPPRWFDHADIEMVALCSASLDADREAKQAALRDALHGAFSASKEGAPTTRFIWGTLEHFREHAERGRQLAEASARDAQRRSGALAPSPTPRAQPQSPPVVTAAQMQADIDRVFSSIGRSDGSR